MKISSGLEKDSGCGFDQEKSTSVTSMRDTFHLIVIVGSLRVRRNQFSGVGKNGEYGVLKIPSGSSERYFSPGRYKLSFFQHRVDQGKSTSITTM